jgi:hypothetical protein
VYFYFSGHGAADRARSVEYLLPADGDPKALDRTAVGLSAFLAALSQTPAKEIIAVVDAGFSGAGARTVHTGESTAPAKLTGPTIPPRVTLLAAVTGPDTAGDWPGGAGQPGTGGLFTHYLTDGVGAALADVDGDGRVTVQEIASWAFPRVTRDARRDKRTQSPVVLLSPGSPTAAQIVLVGGLPER